ncbi:MAG TPA: hypothetical protein VF069_29940 [Streptosporangiaceae bacterium]
MATPICAAPPTTPDLPAVNALQRRCEAFISGELARLARRSPTLGDDELGAVSAAIRRVVDRLVLDRVRARPTDHLAALAALFDFEETTTCTTPDTATTTRITGPCTRPAAGTTPSCSIP